jgi:protein tyrosine/serine phosphatase
MKSPCWLLLVALTSLPVDGLKTALINTCTGDTSTAVSSKRFSAPANSDAAAIVSDEDEAFLQQSKRLSSERNLPLEHVLNARDLASCQNSPIHPGRVFRTGRLSEADPDDVHVLMDELQIKTLVDLRSPTELKDDLNLMRQDVFGNFTTIVWRDRGRKKEGCVRVLPQGEFPFKERFWNRQKATSADATQNMVDSVILGKDHLDDVPTSVDEEECDCDNEDVDVGTLLASKFHENHASRQDRRERMFVSLMNEFKYVKGTLSKLRKRDILRTILKSPASIFSRRARRSIKKPFLKEINIGGLQLLNELLFRYGAPGIRFVLEVCADSSRHPVAFYCTAGKDRTGAIAAIILALCGADLEHIVEDYSLSANVYAEMGDHQAMVGALSQRSLDPKVFLGAPPQVMRDTLLAIQERYGSVESYCDWIGFGPEKQQQLRDALLK